MLLLEPSANRVTNTPPSAKAFKPSSFFTSGRNASRNKSTTCKSAFVEVTVSSLTLRLCVCFLTSASWSLRKSILPIASDRMTCCTSETSCPGVAVSASKRNSTFRSHSCFATMQYAWLPFALCASSITRHTTSDAGHTPSLKSFSMVCGVQKNNRLSLQFDLRVPSKSRFVLPINVHVSASGMPQMSLHAAFCCSTSGRVGARNTTLPCGNQRWKFFITTAAIRVFPRPVGRHTSEFVVSAARVMSNCDCKEKVSVFSLEYGCTVWVNSLRVMYVVYLLVVTIVVS